MIKADLFQNIDLLLEYLYKYSKTRIIDFTSKPEDKDIFRQVYKEIYPHVTPDLNCLQCILDCLNNLLAWKTREYPKYLQTIQQVVADPADQQSQPMNESYSEPIKAKKKPIRKKKVISKEEKPK